MCNYIYMWYIPKAAHRRKCIACFNRKANKLGFHIKELENKTKLKRN